MASQNRRKISDLNAEIRQQMFKSAHTFSFYQTYRLLKRIEDQNKRSIHSEPRLSFSFPASDVSEIHEDMNGDFNIIVNFLGLFGVSSPLPAFYTEKLMDDEKDDISASKTFMTLINDRFYELLFQVWLKNNIHLRVVEFEDPRQTDQLFSFLGLIEKQNRKELDKPFELLRYAGLFSQHPRSAMALETILQDAFKDIPVTVIPAQLRKVNIPNDQIYFLGKPHTAVGHNVMIGSELMDRMGKFRLEIGPMDAHQFNTFIPGGENFKKGTSLVALFLTDPLEYDIKVILKKGEVKTARLGTPADWSSLGISTWLFSGANSNEVFTIFKPYKGVGDD